MYPKVEFHQGENGEWYWRVKAENGKIVADGGEGYTREADAVRAFTKAKYLMEEAFENWIEGAA